MIEIKPQVFWTGKIDWDIKFFHGHEFSTQRGTSYNSYLIKDEMTVLVDTVWYPYKEEFMQNLLAEIPLLDAIVINHMEPDHGGSLAMVMDARPDLPIYCTKNGADIIKAHFHKDWDFRIVKTGDFLETGKYALRFVEMQMIHWPDSMMTYVDGAKLLLSNDAFGQHIAPGGLFDDVNDLDIVLKEAYKYYVNILAPLSGLIKKKLTEVMALNLDIDMIAPSHGVIWRTYPGKIIEHYLKWVEGAGDGSVSVIFETMYDSTRQMADEIAKGLQEAGVKYKIWNVATADRSDLLAEIYKSSGVIVGSCTVLNGALRETTSLLEDMKMLKFKGKMAGAYGSYGWSGEAPKQIFEKLQLMGMTLVGEPIRVKYRPDAETLAQLVQYGRDFMKGI
ncbi:MAG: flavodoxin domain-containing protein [Clostridia bacterium]